MILLTENSILKHLPEPIGQFELQKFDAIRTTLEILQFNYNQLENLLTKLSEGGKKENESIIFSHAWSIIDYSDKLNYIFRRLFISESNFTELDFLNDFRILRNTFHHLDERIKHKLTINPQPIYGTLTWNFIDEQEIIPHALISGLAYNAVFKSRIENSSLSKIGNITLVTMDDKGENISLDITCKMHKLKDYINKLENLLISNFENNNLNSNNWDSRRDILIRMINQD